MTATQPRSAATPADLLALSAPDLDTQFATAAVHSIPVGKGRGLAIFAPGSRLSRPLAHLTRALAWKGKEFDLSRDGLVNIVSPFSVRAIRARVGIEPSWVDNEPCIVLDYSRTSWSARWIRDEIREVAPGVFLGVVFVRRRRLPLCFVLSFAA